MISLTPLEIMLQNHKKCSFPACSYWNMHWSPKYYMTESKYSERPPSSLANLAQIVMWSVRRQEIQLKLYFKFKFFLCFRGNKAWCSNHKIIFNTEKYSFKYLYLKQKQISTWSLPKMVVYTSKKLQKRLHWKKSLASHGNTYWYPKGHMRKSDDFRKPLLSSSRFVLNYVTCQASRVILKFLLWVT